VCVRQVSPDSIVQCLIVQMIVPTMEFATTGLVSVTINGKETIARSSKILVQTIVPTTVSVIATSVNAFAMRTIMEHTATSGSLPLMDHSLIHAATIVQEMECASMRKVQTELLLKVAFAPLIQLDLSAKVSAKLDAQVMVDALKVRVLVMMVMLDQVVNGRPVPLIAMTMGIAEMEFVCAKMDTLEKIVEFLLTKPCHTNASNIVHQDV